MTWIFLCGVAVCLVLFFAARTHQRSSTHELGKGAGRAGRACYKNRGSRQREKQIK